MPEEPAPPPAPSPSLIQRFLPPGALTDKQKQWGFLAVMLLAVIVVVFSGTGKNDSPAAQKQPVRPVSNPVPIARIQESTEAMQQDVERLKQARTLLLEAQQNAQRAEQPVDVAQNTTALQGAALPNARYGQQPAPYARQYGAPMTSGQTQTQQAHAAAIGRIGFDASPAVNSPTRSETPAAQAVPEPKGEEKERSALGFDPSLPTCTLPEQTVIETVLTNRLQGANAGPVDTMVTTPVYCPGTATLLIPQGARFAGETSSVSLFGQQRLAVSFHRILIQKNSKVYSVPLDKATPGLDQEGATALTGKVNNHYFSIFGSALAIGAIGGLAQVGNGYSGFGYDPSVEMRNGLTQSLGQSSSRVLDRFLNRMPTVTIPEGTRVKIMLTGDVPVPVFGE